jgi:hypothetical protein
MWHTADGHTIMQAACRQESSVSAQMHDIMLVSWPLAHILHHQHLKMSMDSTSTPAGSTWWHDDTAVEWIRPKLQWHHHDNLMILMTSVSVC